MKKTFIIMAAAALLSQAAQAQDKDIQQMQSGVSLEWDKPKGDDNIIRLDLVYKHLVVGGSYIIGTGKNDIESGPGKKEDEKGFDVHIGGNYRYFLGDGSFYVEARLLAGYFCKTQKKVVRTQTVNHLSGFGDRLQTTTEVNDIWKTERVEEGFNLSLTPRIGFQSNGYSLYAGIGWNFVGADKKFKDVNFDKKFNGYYFTVGVAKLF